MHVGIGYSENPKTSLAGKEAAEEALSRAKKTTPCDMVLLFATARHEAQALREAIVQVVGPQAKIVGGAAVGGISNDRFGYAGDQIIMAAIWLENSTCEILREDDLVSGEAKVGNRLGNRLKELGTNASAPVLLFYDAINRTAGDVKMLMATPLLAGLEESLGYLPYLIGAGLMGDFTCSATQQWTGDGISQHSALALKLGGIHMDHVIMHGCKPAGTYYTVTKADNQTILEINNQPALPFIQSVMGASMTVDKYPFFLIFGVNEDDKWAEFDEKSYANRLCLAIDKERNGIVMFEPDMVAGTEFQIMYRSMDFDYIPPKVESLFANLAGRKPVLAVYINCAGRAGGYGGMNTEDAVIVQQAIAERVPLLGIYSGVEIASVRGKPRGLDWTGVLVLFSVQE